MVAVCLHDFSLSIQDSTGIVSVVEKLQILKSKENLFYFEVRSKTMRICKSLAIYAGLALFSCCFRCDVYSTCFAAAL